MTVAPAFSTSARDIAQGDVPAWALGAAGCPTQGARRMNPPLGGSDSVLWEKILLRWRKCLQSGEPLTQGRVAEDAMSGLSFMLEKPSQKVLS